MSKPVLLLLLSLIAVSVISVACRPLLAHHSYARYEPDKVLEFTGAVTAVQWANPHILFDVSDGNVVMRIEWVTTAGADKTGVAQLQIEVGDELTAAGSRHRDADVYTMSRITELSVPAKNWHWISPSITGLRP